MNIRVFKQLEVGENRIGEEKKILILNSQYHVNVLTGVIYFH